MTQNLPGFDFAKVEHRGPIGKRLYLRRGGAYHATRDYTLYIEFHPNGS